MNSLLYFLLWAGLIFVMMRFGCGSHIAGHGRSRNDGGLPDRERPDLRWVPPETGVDPVCGRTVNTGKAKSSVYDGSVYYFCSRECREMFEAAPLKYMDGGQEDRARLEHSNA